MKKRIFSTFMALVMVLGVLLTPFNTASAASDNDINLRKPEYNFVVKGEVTEKVTLHKLVMSKEHLSAWDSDKIQEAGYDGTQNTDQLKALLAEGHSAKEVAGVYFAVKYNSGNNKGKYVTIKEVAEQLPEYGAVESLDSELPEGHKLLAGKTTATGIEFNTIGLKGDFLIEEIHAKSSYVGEDGEAITDSKAVPVEITLPLVNDNGVVEKAHVYPKNTEEKPQIDKNFLKDNELTAAEGFDAADLLKVGAEYKNYQEKKATAKAEIDKNIPYEVKTEIPAKSNLAEAHWDDKMTEGLTFNKDLEVTVDGAKLTAEQYELTEDERGFSLRLNEKGLKLLNGKENPVTVVLKYSATVNSNAIADIPEANDISFFYGNTPSKGTTSKPTKPNDNGEVKVEKTWDKGSEWEEGEWAKFKLVDANTGEDVKATDLVNAPEDYTFEGTVKLEKDGNHTYTWKYLNKDKQYKVVEVESKTLSDAAYEVNEKGIIEVTNHKSTNPKPLNPTEPKVVLGGKKFVKTNQEGTERLAGAEFYVQNEEGKYLVTDKKDETKVTDAKEALDKAVKAYNERVKGEKETEEAFANREKELKNAIDTAQAAYNKAFKENAINYRWEASKDNAVVLVSDAQGRFEITGLEYGTYKLEEKTAPKGYAKLNGEIEFKVEKGSYNGSELEFEYNVELAEGETQTYGKQIKNKKVSIPQTGGIGSLIFLVVGISLMGLALFAYRKNQQEA
ncbi:pilin N-terminal domain-containing protein [Helcococcus sueciensis]|uniref:pilin N-terminal domain-containing protein n=1 Tax=Helcococcus sueciensis TaxID=241555 RepID=UPI000400AF0C|nr:pilin N-terminal domain-containing protein [Helcococcus sueciensis]